MNLQAQRRVKTVGAKTRAFDIPDDYPTPYIAVVKPDWLPRSAQDFEGSMRLSRAKPLPVSRPNPHAIGALCTLFPQLDLWRVLGGASRMVPGPFTGGRGDGAETAPGTHGYFPLWYQDLIKQY